MRFPLLACCLALTLSPANAQNLGSVPNPDVTAGETSIEYRFAFAPGAGGEPSVLGQRIHVQHALTGAWRLRLAAFQSMKGGGDLRYRGVQPELQWQFLESEATGGLDSALFVQGLIPDGNDGPGRVRVGLANKYAPGERVELRLQALAAREIGDRARDGFVLEARTQAVYKFSTWLGAGAQTFHNFNSTAAFGAFDDQRHQAGPVILGRLSRRLGYNASLLFGMSERAADEELRLFLSHSL